jgi:hypothetical protein
VFNTAKRSLSAVQSNFPESIMMPPMDVPCPPMYLVSEWITISAPCSKGLHKYGVATVLSTINGTLCLCAMSAKRSISTMLPAGLPIDSQKITGGKASGILSFGIKGDADAGGKFIDALQMILRLVNIGDAKSLACHPASTTHRQLNETELAAAGVSSDLVRISVGIESIDDIIADVNQALESAS